VEVDPQLIGKAAVKTIPASGPIERALSLHRWGIIGLMLKSGNERHIFIKAAGNLVKA